MCCSLLYSNQDAGRVPLLRRTFAETRRRRGGRSDPGPPWGANICTVARRGHRGKTIAPRLPLPKPHRRDNPEPTGAGRDRASGQRSYLPPAAVTVAVGEVAMFGTISRMRLKEGVTIDQLKDEMGNENNRPASSLALIVLQSVDDPREVWVAGAFESRDAYFQNADSPEQN